MRCVLALFALTGCTQIFGLTEPVKEGAASDASSTDILVATDVPADTALAPCDGTDATLIACFDFEGSVVDQSASATAVAPSNVTFVPGRQGMAVHVGATSMATLAPSTVFNVTSVTVEAWIRIDELPLPGKRAGVFDSDARYGLFVHDDGSFSFRNVSTAGALIVAGVWTHLAVADDGAKRQYYRNGLLVVDVASSTLPTSTGDTEIGGNAPTGERFIGAIDSLRVYRAIRSSAQICTSAGC